MLPPVNSAPQVQPVSTAAIGQREARSDAPSPAGQPVQAAQQAAAQPLPQGATPEALQSLRQLADLLGSQQINTHDILTRLAIDFADALGQGPLPEETAANFATRLVTLIKTLPEPDRQSAARVANLTTLGISASALAEALADPASPAAARIVAMAEDPGARGLQQMLQSAIDSYEQNSATAPPTIAAQKSANEPTPGQSEAKQPQPAAASGEASKPAVAAPSTADSKPAASASPAASQTPAGPETANNAAKAQPQAGAAYSAPPRADQPALTPAKAESSNVNASQAMANRTVPDEGQPTMQVLRGFNVVVEKVATRAADVLKSVAAVAQQAEAAKSFAPASSTLVEASRQSRPEPLRAMPIGPESEIAGKAHEAARAMEGKVVQLFARAPLAEDADQTDIDRLIRVAEQTAAKAEPPKAAAEAVLVQARQAEGVPFAQVPYPFVREEEENRRRRGFGEQAEGGDGEEMAGEDGQSLWHGDGEQAERHDEPEIDEYPFDADEPLKRNPSDAERALHMYQRFGGF